MTGGAVDTRRFEEILRRRRAELDARLHGIEDRLDDPASADSEERASEREEDEVLEDLGRAGLDEMRMIDGALARIAEGTYGICAKCGDDISVDRLEAVPHAVTCKECVKAGA